MIDCYTLPGNDQVFTQIMPGGHNVVYAVTRIREHCLRTFHPVTLTALLPSHAQLIMKQRGVEKERLIRAAFLTRHYSPLLYLDQDDGTHLLADGSHTYVARFLRGHRWALAYIVPKKVWRGFLVTGFPTETMDEATLLATHSKVKL